MKRTRSPLADDGEVLGAVAAVEEHRVDAGLTFDGVAAVAGIPLEGVVVAAEVADVVPLLTVDEVAAVPAEQAVGAIAPEEDVAAVAAVDGDRDQPAQRPGARERVVLAVGVEDEVLDRRDVDAERPRVEAVEADPLAVGRGRELLGPVAAVDLGGVDIGTALVEIGVVAGVPDQTVVAGLAERSVVAVAADQRVVAGAAEHRVGTPVGDECVAAGLADQRVDAGAAPQRVVAGAAEQAGPWQCAVRLVEAEGVGAVETDHGQRSGVGDRRHAATDRDGTAVDDDVAGDVATDGDGVVLGITRDGEHAEGEERGRGRRRHADGHGGAEHASTERRTDQQPARPPSPSIVVVSYRHHHHSPLGSASVGA